MKVKSENGRFLQRFIPARVIFVLMGFLGFNLVYAYKVVLSMSIIAMLNHTKTVEKNTTTSGQCIAESGHGHQDFPGVKFDWDDQVKSQLLSAFFYGYIITQIPAGILATRFGAKWIFGTSLLISGVLSLFGPMAAKIDWRLFMATRIGQGLAEGVVFPCMNALIAQWIPKMERSRGTTIIYTGATIGTVLTLPMTAILSKSTFLGSWEASFYILGVVGIVWFVLWAVLISESPESHPFISRKERKFILENDGGLKAVAHLKIPYKEMFTSVPVYALIVTHFGQNWGFLTVLNLMPSYMNTVLKMDINENILISGLPYLGQTLFGWLCSYVSDMLRQKGTFTITTIRKVNSFIAYVPPAICLALVPLVECNSTLATILLILAMTFNGACFSSLNSTHGDMAPTWSGTLMGITNSIGNIPGFLATIVAAKFTQSGDTVANWSKVFYLSAGVFIATATVYCLGASCEEQPWGRSEPQATKKDDEKESEDECID